MPATFKLTKREQDVFALTILGHGTAEVARRLSMNKRSVKRYKASIREKNRMRQSLV